MTRSRSPRSRNKRRSSAPHPLFGWVIKLGLVGLVVLAGFAIYLDAVVQEKFSGKRWTVPAKVYARPLELFVGQKLTKTDFLTELVGAGGFYDASHASRAIRRYFDLLPTEMLAPKAFVDCRQAG